ncbi:MAG: cytochrome c [Bacteroidetes bacterium]|nr:cytochrome c [Bacteroidota bacterium]
MLFKKTNILIFLALCLSACVATLYVPTEKDAVKNKVTLHELQQGRELYIKNCSSCHNLHLPSEYTRHEWWTKVDRMQTRAKIDSAQKQLIVKYLESNCKK